MQALSTTYLPVSEGELIKTALGASWGALHPNIQRRFDHNPTATEQLYYQGTLDNLWQFNCWKVVSTLHITTVRRGFNSGVSTARSCRYCGIF